MSTINIDDLILGEDCLVVIPGRSDSDIVRTEKKYDRHFIGLVVKTDLETEVCKHGAVIEDSDTHEISYDVKGVKPKKGDMVFYDDSDSVETELIVDGKKEKIEIISAIKVVAIAKGGK